MDREQAEQEVTLVQVRMETDSVEVSHRAKGSHDWIKCAGAFVAGLAVALAVGIVLHCFVFTPSCKQDAPALSDASKAMPYKLKKTTERERYDIFTANKAATYLIYGWVKLPHCTREDFVLEQIRDSARTIQRNNTHTTEVFLFSKVKLADKTRVSLRFKSDYTDSLFHVYAL